MGIWEKIKNFLLKIYSDVKPLFFKFFPGKKRQIAAACVSGGVIIILIFVIFLTRRPAVEPLSEKEIVVTPNLIPFEDFFLPDEPDYLPGILLERGRREKWTEEDAEEYWRNPMISGEDEWRNNIEETIDKLMERIP